MLLGIYLPFNVISSIAWLLGVEIFIVIIQSYVVNAKYFLRSYPQKRSQVILLTLRVTSILMVSILTPIGLKLIYIPSNMYELIVIIGLLGAVVWAICYFFLLSVQEKESVKSIIVSKHE